MFTRNKHKHLKKKSREVVLKGICNLKDSLSGLRSFAITESPSKMMENVFYFMLKAFFLLEMFTFLS